MSIVHQTNNYPVLLLQYMHNIN